MEPYELTLVLDKATTLEELTTIRHEIGMYTTEEIGYNDLVVDKVKPLFYKLDGHTEGGYAYVDLWLRRENANGLEKHLNSIKRVIRYLLVLKEDKNER